MSNLGIFEKKIKELYNKGEILNTSIKEIPNEKLDKLRKSAIRFSRLKALKLAKQNCILNFKKNLERLKNIGMVNVEAPDWLKTSINIYCYEVKRGKPAANMSIQSRYVSVTERLIHNCGLNLFKENLAEGWKAIWIYRYPHILDVIKKTLQVPETIYDHWVLGKLFGYSEEAIQKFLNQSL